MKKHPLIGLTPQFDEEKDRTWMRDQYTKAIFAAGGIPVIVEQLPEKAYCDALCASLDGILFTGGRDIDPARYGEEKLPECGGIQKARDSFEWMLFASVREAGLPALGICRGIQLMNAAGGGTLFQHRDGHDGTVHPVQITPGTRLSAIFGGRSEVQVNSYHHQGVKVPAPFCRVSAVSPDGVIEAIEAEDGPFFVGVQWHPEYLYGDDPLQMALFQAFADACCGASAD